MNENDVSNIRGPLAKFELMIRRNEIKGSYKTARKTAKLFLHCLNGNITDIQTDLLIKALSEKLQAHFPDSVIIKNVCKHILIQLETENNQRIVSTSFFEMFAAGRPASPPRKKAGEEVLSLNQRMKEIIDEIYISLKEGYKKISSFADQILIANDVVLTLGYSQSVINLLTASHRRKITAFIPERAPSYDGLDLAKDLRAKNVTVIVIPDSAIFAVLPRVRTVIIPARTVLPDGGVIAFSPAHPVALAAKQHARPVIVLYWSLKLSSTFPKALRKVAPAGTVLMAPIAKMENGVALNPDGDYIPPNLITLMLNEDGAHLPGDAYWKARKVYSNDGDE